MKEPSEGEELVWLHCRAHGLDPEREYRFALPRRFRFDFAWPDHKLAGEIEGGTWIAGRDSRGGGYEKDLEKYNVAVLAGWRVLRYTTQMVNTVPAIDQIMQALGK